MGVTNMYTYFMLTKIAIVFGFLSHIHMGTCVSLHISEVLGIHIFSIEDPNKFTPFSNEKP